MKVAFWLVVLLAAPGLVQALPGPIENDAGTGGDAGDTQDTATKLGADGPAAGTYPGLLILAADGHDWFRFSYARGGAGESLLRVHAAMEAGPRCVTLPVGLTVQRVALVDATGRERAAVAGAGCHFVGDLAMADAPAGDYFLHLSTTFSVPNGTIPPGVPPLPLAPVHQEGASLEQDYVFTLTCKPDC